MEEIITNKIKQIRRNKNITLKALADKTGLTEGYLSKIENSETAPPIPTLRRIASALEFDLSYFFLSEDIQQDENPKIVVERDVTTMEARFSANPVQTDDHGYNYEPLALKKRGKNMEPYLVSPDFELGGVVQFNGEVFHYILKGEIEFFYGAKKYQLSRGDSSYFDANIPFQARSIGNERAMILVIAYPYRRS